MRLMPGRGTSRRSCELRLCEVRIEQRFPKPLFQQGPVDSLHGRCFSLFGVPMDRGTIAKY